MSRKTLITSVIVRTYTVLSAVGDYWPKTVAYDYISIVMHQMVPKVKSRL